MGISPQDGKWLRGAAGQQTGFTLRLSYLLTLAFGLTFALCETSAGGETSASKRKPNVVIILADDLGYGELGCYGGKEIPTPQIDAIASGGVRFSSGYVTAPFCAASRAGLLTGRYQTRFGFEFNPIGPQNSDPAIGLPPSERTLADLLREGGYVTSLVGKWHLGGTARFHPQRRGFDDYFGFLHEGHYFVPPPWSGHVTWLRRKMLPDGSSGRWTSPDGRIIWSTHLGQFEPSYDADNPILRSSQPVEEAANLTDAFTREAERFIERSRDQPFFLCLAYNAVHSPMQGADAYLKRFAHIPDVQRRIFAALLAQLDDGVGKVLTKLRECQLEQDTLVVFLSDNGGPTRELTSSNHPLRGEKGTLLEGGIRVPFIVRWPGKIPVGRTENRPVISLDLFATAVAAAEAAPTAQFDGVNLLPHLISGDSGPIHERLFWRVGPQAALRQGDWKIVRERESPAWRLFHLGEDSGEAKDLAQMEPARVAGMEAAWKKIDAEMVEPLWGGKPNGNAAGR